MSIDEVDTSPVESASEKLDTNTSVSIEKKKSSEDFLANADPEVLVIILQCDTKPADPNITNLQWVFSDPYFVVQVCTVQPPATTPPPTSTLSTQQYIENYIMQKALTYAAEGPCFESPNGTLVCQKLWVNLPVIIIKDSSVCNITPPGTTTIKHPNPSDDIIAGMTNRIMTALKIAPNANLYYLCKWNDMCNQYTDIDGGDYIDRGSSLKWTYTQPTSTQAIMYTPWTRDFIANQLVTATVPLGQLLNMFISQQQLRATVFSPNIISYDINLATSNSDYLKMNECAPVPTTTTTNATAFVWFLILLAIIILVAWALIQIGPGGGGG